MFLISPPPPLPPHRDWILRFCLFFSRPFSLAKTGEYDSKRSDSVAKTDDETTDKIWEDTDKDCDQTEQSNIENNNEDEDDASVERYWFLTLIFPIK